MMDFEEFKTQVWDYFLEHGRDLPWRQTDDPYLILVSEIMLQQTQVSRVEQQYRKFTNKWPTPESLAKAPLSQVLTMWSGLGYNRRAKYLHQAAKSIVHDFAGKIPNDRARLLTLPGVGQNTAAAICVYSFNEPLVFIETNVRTVFIHHFFADQTDINDKDILALVEATLDHENPREWYWALMDYGSYLKRKLGNLNFHSKHYKKQSRFEGSKRQLRGQVLRNLLAGPQSVNTLINKLKDNRVNEVLKELENDGMIIAHRNEVRLAD